MPSPLRSVHSPRSDVTPYPVTPGGRRRRMRSSIGKQSLPPMSPLEPSPTDSVPNPTLPSSVSLYSYNSDNHAGRGVLRNHSSFPELTRSQSASSSRLEAQVHALAIELSRLREQGVQNPSLPAQAAVSNELPPTYEQHEDDDLISRPGSN